MIGSALDISWFFQGHEEFGKTVARNLVVKVISVICIFIFIKNSNDLYKYFVIYVLSILIGNVSLWLYLPKFLVKINIKKINIFKHLKPTISLLIPQIAIQVYTLLDKTMIGVMIIDKSEVGFYDQSQKIIKLILTIITSLGTVMLPRIANTFVEGDNGKIKKYLIKSFNVVFFMAFPFIMGIVAVSSNFVPIFFGDGYDKVIDLMSIISPIILFIGISNVIGMQYLLPTKRQKEFTISVMFGALINFAANLILIRFLGAIGAAIGTIIAELTVTIIQMYFVRKDFEYRKFFKMMKNYFLSSMIMFLVCFIIGKIVDNNMLALVIQLISGILVYFGILLILKDSFLGEVLKKMKRKKENVE